MTGIFGIVAIMKTAVGINVPIPVAAHTTGARREDVRSRNAMNALVDGVRWMCNPSRHPLREKPHVRAPIDAVDLQQLPRVGREGEPLRDRREADLAHAERVAHEDQLPRAPIPDRKCEITGESRDHIQAAGRVPVEHEPRVGPPGGISDAEPAGDVLPVVDAAVEHDRAVRP